MGMLVDGQWTTEGYRYSGSGAFRRDESRFRNWVTADGAPGPSGAGGFAAEPGRYHLYVSLACPWAHRTLIMRRLKGLEEAIGVSVVHWLMLENGWTFEPGPGVIPDTVNGCRHLYELYQKADREATTRVTVPVLWDKQRETIVSNESAEIIRMLDSAFEACGARGCEYYPEPLRPAIDEINARVYETLNNGVYRCGFARTQAAYVEAVGPLFETLDWLEARLSAQRYVAGDTLTEADWRLFTTLVRFDAVYHGHFKCNLRRLMDYPALWAYTRELYQHPGVAVTVDFMHIKHHYYGSHESINPTRIVPAGPILAFDEPHGRG